jgi:hypothetical protein
MPPHPGTGRATGPPGSDGGHPLSPEPSAAGPEAVGDRGQPLFLFLSLTGGWLKKDKQRLTQWDVACQLRPPTVDWRGPRVGGPPMLRSEDTDARHSLAAQGTEREHP